MTFFDHVKDSIATRAAEGIAASLTVLLVWAAYQVAPVALPAIEAAVSKQVLLALLVTSLVLNFIFLIVVWLTSKKEPFRLKYGIYWDKDKNPHCPSCKIPVAAYGDYQLGGRGYYCKPCKKVFALADASGKNINPATAIAEL
ncbi:MAG TPA: hypothetical protein VMV48_05560 [Gallionellaceae bacterium]|nr:hypothetical protein [Gallionellaceae bacterium]